MAGLGALRTVWACLVSALLICGVLTAAALVMLRLRQPVPHLGHTVVAMLALGTISGPGMAPPAAGIGRFLTPSRPASELLLRAGAGMQSPPGDWRQAGLSVLVAVALALAVFWLSARSRA